MADFPLKLHHTEFPEVLCFSFTQKFRDTLISSDEKGFSQLIQNYFITLYPYPNLENHLYSESFVSEKKHLLFLSVFSGEPKAGDHFVRGNVVW